ncbi:hypothetical protein [Streptomyces sennicomposti]
MHALRRRLERSLAAQAALLFPLAVGIAAFFHRHSHPLVWVIQGALYTAAGMGSVAVQRRRYSRRTGVDPRRITELSRKIRRREVPQDGEERAVMRKLVDTQRAQLRRTKRWLPYWMGCMGLLAVGLLVLGVASGSLMSALVFAVTMIALCSWIIWIRRRSTSRLDHMHAALGGRDEEASSTSRV